MKVVSVGALNLASFVINIPLFFCCFKVVQIDETCLIVKHLIYVLVYFAKINEYVC